MIRVVIVLLAAAATALWSHAAGASSSRWETAEGGRVRLVSSGLPDETGRLRAILEIDLKPGWKTYWREPGAAGVPPSIDASGSPQVEAATLAYPAPERHFDGDLPWAGYGRSVALPVTFSITPGRLEPIDVSVFLGLCETICVPLQANLTLDPTEAPDDPADAARVANAFDALPLPASDGFGVKLQEVRDGTAVFETMLPAGAQDADLFLAADGYVFGLPERKQVDGRTVFVVSVEAPAAASGVVHYTLVTSEGAVSGNLDAF